MKNQKPHTLTNANRYNECQELMIHSRKCANTKKLPPMEQKIKRSMLDNQNQNQNYCQPIKCKANITMITMIYADSEKNKWIFYLVIDMLMTHDNTWFMCLSRSLPFSIENSRFHRQTSWQTSAGGWPTFCWNAVTQIDLFITMQCIAIGWRVKTRGRRREREMLNGIIERGHWKMRKKTFPTTASIGSDWAAE